MRFPLAFSLLALSALGQADRLITIPTARKIPFGTVRYEFRIEPGEIGDGESLLGIGISTAFDMEIRTDQETDGPAKATFDFSYNYVAALTGLSPGISFGMQDAANTTPDGRRFFAVTTWREPCSTLNGDFPADISLGVFVARRSTPFVGVELPFSKQFHLLAEHNGERISAGAEYWVTPSLNLRAQERGQQTLFSFQLMTHF